MDRERCLLCQCKIEEPNSSESPEEVIFLLRKVLGVPVSLLAKFRRGCPRVEAWVSVCGQCQALVRECRQIYDQLCQVTRKWNERQTRIRGMIRDVKVENEEEAEVVVLDIGREVRDWVLSSDNSQQQDDIHVTEQDDLELEQVYEELTSSPPSDVDPLAEEGDAEGGEKVEEESDGDWEWETPDTDPQALDPDTAPPSPPPPPEQPPQNERLLQELQLKYPSTFRSQLSYQRINFSKSEVRLHCPVPGCQFTVANPQDTGRLSRHQTTLHSTQELASLPQTPFIYECLKCHMRYNSRATLKDHLHMRHRPGAPEEPDERIPCPVSACPFVCANLRVLNNHKKHSHTKAEMDALPHKAAVQCRECGKGLRTKGELRAHLAKVHDEGDFHCPQCDRVFSSQRALNFHLDHRHRKAQSRARKAALQMRDLSKRVLDSPEVYQGSKKRRLQCPHCPYNTVSKPCLEAHVKRVHEGGQKPVQCELCGQGVASPAFLTHHQADKHGICGVKDCAVQLDTKEQLHAHELEAHGGQMYLFRCDDCGAIYVTRQRLRRHKSQVHPPGGKEGGGVAHICEVCGKGFTSREYLVYHVSYTHQKKMRKNKL